MRSTWAQAEDVLRDIPSRAHGMINRAGICGVGTAAVAPSSEHSCSLRFRKDLMRIYDSLSNASKSALATAQKGRRK